MSLEVCVIIAARNAEATIAKAVASALAQEHVREVIAVDDASADATRAAALSADDGSGRLKVLTAERNLGPAGARNRALAHAASPYFCVLDADDYMLPGRMARLLASADGGWDMIADDIIILPQASALSFSLRRDGDAAQALDLERFALGNITRPGRPRGELGFLKPVVSRAFMAKHGLAYDEGLRLGEDYAFYVQALLAGARFALVSACGYVAVERPDSLSSRHSTEDLRRIYAFDQKMLDAQARLTGGERAALVRHRDASWLKYVYGAALDIRRTEGMRAALRYLAGRPSAIPYIATETARAKLAAFLERIDPQRARAGGHLRLLVGLPDARLADVRPIGAPETTPLLGGLAVRGSAVRD